MIADFLLFTNTLHEIMFIDFLGMSIPETALYVMFVNTCPLFVTLSLVYGQQRYSTRT